VGTAERAATVIAHDGVILDVLDGITDVPDAVVIDVPGDCVLLPGLVDTHVHVNEPGRTEWEGFATATAAAAAGGITTFVDMPLNSIPATVDATALTVKREVAAPQVMIDVAFWAGAIPGNLDELEALHDAGVVGFKCFMLPSGVPEFPPLDRAGLVEAMRCIASFGGLLIAHAESQEVIDAAPTPNGTAYAAFLDSRPPQAEVDAITVLLDATRQTGCRTHIVHLSAASALPTIAAAKAEGLPLTVETCPHYLSLAAERVPAGATSYKCCPPIRSERNRDALWAGLVEGTIDLVVSDHSPCTPALKSMESGDFGEAWGGIASLELSLSIVWTEAQQRGVSLIQVVTWMAAQPAILAGLSMKGGIAIGKDADLVVFAPDAEFVVDPKRLHHRHAVTPYASQTLRGVVRRTYLSGVAVEASSPRGRLLQRAAS
jgi:allantoinase